jgi:predicted transport protein
MRRLSSVSPAMFPKLGHHGTGDLEITFTKSEDLERAMPVIKRSYEES